MHHFLFKMCGLIMPGECVCGESGGGGGCQDKYQRLSFESSNVKELAYMTTSLFGCFT